MRGEKIYDYNVEVAGMTDYGITWMPSLRNRRTHRIGAGQRVRHLPFRSDIGRTVS